MAFTAAVRWCGLQLGWWSANELSLRVTWGMHSMSSLGYLSVFLLFMGVTRLGWSLRGSWLLAGLTLEGLLGTRGQCLAMVGMLGLMVHRPQGYRYWSSLALTIALYPPVSELSLSWLSRATPQLYDSTAMQLDRLWLPLRPRPPAGLIPGLQVVYVSLSAVLGLALYWSFINASRSSFSFLRAYLWAGVLGYLTYPMLPMVGPEAFAEQNLHQARSCLPSLHVLWAVLVARCLNELPGWWGPLGTAYALLVAVASYWIGDHYLVDIWLALPLAAAIYPLSRWNWSTCWWITVAGALLATWGWVLAFRLAPNWLLDHAVLTRSLQLLTAVVSLGLLKGSKCLQVGGPCDPAVTAAPSQHEKTG